MYAQYALMHQGQYVMLLVSHNNPAEKLLNWFAGLLARPTPF